MRRTTVRTQALGDRGARRLLSACAGATTMPMRGEFHRHLRETPVRTHPSAVQCSVSVRTEKTASRHQVRVDIPIGFGLGRRPGVSGRQSRLFLLGFQLVQVDWSSDGMRSGPTHEDDRFTSYHIQSQWNVSVPNVRGVSSRVLPKTPFHCLFQHQIAELIVRRQCLGEEAWVSQYGRTRRTAKRTLSISLSISLSMRPPHSTALLSLSLSSGDVPLSNVVHPATPRVGEHRVLPPTMHSRTGMRGRVRVANPIVGATRWVGGWRKRWSACWAVDFEDRTSADPPPHRDHPRHRSGGCAGVDDVGAVVEDVHHSFLLPVRRLHHHHVQEHSVTIGRGFHALHGLQKVVVDQQQDDRK